MDDIDREIQRMDSAYQGVFERVERATEDERAYILWRLHSDWCIGCGKPTGTCNDFIKGCCCGIAKVTVMARYCPNCEFIDFDSIRPVT